MSTQPELQTITMSARDVAELGVGVGLSNVREATLDIGQGPRRYRVVSIESVQDSPEQLKVTWRPLADGEFSF